MPDEPTEAEVAQARMILSGAIAAAGKAESTVAWKGRINALIPEVASMLGPGSAQMKRTLAMMNATVFVAKFLGFETDFLTATGKKDESTRIQVLLEHPKDKRHPDGIQRLRTERTDTQVGKKMAEKLEQLTVGNDVICWKVLEDMKGDGETMAVLYHVQERRRDSGTRAVPSPSQSQGGGAVPPPSRRESDPGATPSPLGSDSEMEAFNNRTIDLENKAKIALVRELTNKQLWPPTTSNIDAVLVFINEWEVF